MITSDENDHFAGSAPTPAGCDGIHMPCTYPPGHKGEVDANLNRLFLGEFSDSTPFNIDFDDAPGIWIDGNPAQTDPATRKLERGGSTSTRLRSDHRRHQPNHASNGRSRGAGLAPHGYIRPEPDAKLHPVCQSGLFLSDSKFADALHGDPNCFTQTR